MSAAVPTRSMNERECRKDKAGDKAPGQRSKTLVNVSDLFSRRCGSGIDIDDIFIS